MKEHESRILKKGETAYFYTKWVNNGIYGFKSTGDLIYVDSNNFIHNIEKIANPYQYIPGHYIHGRFLVKDKWEKEVHRIKILSEL